MPGVMVELINGVDDEVMAVGELNIDVYVGSPGDSAYKALLLKSVDQTGGMDQRIGLDIDFKPTIPNPTEEVKGDKLSDAYFKQHDKDSDGNLTKPEALQLVKEMTQQQGMTLESKDFEQFWTSADHYADGTIS